MKKKFKKTFKKLFNLKFKGCKKEIIAINDGSTDRSPHILKN